MKKRTVITTEKREVWVIRPLSGETEEERREGADDSASSKSSLPEKVKEEVKPSQEKE
ncbi:MAG: hypothetical protein M3362_17315 [Acidobacteriota bacterium]|nr:hypothetical protein [Acidobacteriota bacterium]